MLTLRKSAVTDAEFWERLGKIPPKSGEALVISDGAQSVGVLHYTLLWGELPFLNLLFICGDKRGEGYGKGALAAWENMLCAAGYTTALLSTRADENGQYFFGRCGYTACGALDMHGFTAPQEAAELFFYKNL